MEYVTLNNGVKMPALGYGVYLVSPEECERCVSDAIETGYRSIDTAQAYFNEEGVGRAVARCGVPRGELFLTTKIWISNAGYDKARTSIAESLRKLRTDYLDLLLIHQPFGDYYGTYRAMEEAYMSGLARAIGLSNFYPDRFVDLAHFCEIKPAVNQVETHVFQQQKAARAYLRKYNTQIESWSPFARGENNLFSNPVLTGIGGRHGDSGADRPALPLAEQGGGHPQIHPQGAYGRELRGVRLQPFRSGNAGDRGPGQREKRVHQPSGS